MHIDSPIDRVDTRAVTDSLGDAAAVAGHAPSIHNTQPWRWALAGNTLDLHLDRRRVLDVTDPDARLAILSCGAALHHARTALAAQGWATTVSRLPNAADQDHLAHIRVDGPARVDAAAQRHLTTIASRHTDRRPVGGALVASDDLRAIVAAVEGEGSWLQILHADQVLDLAASADHAQRAEAAAPIWQVELSYWTGAAIPDTASHSGSDSGEVRSTAARDRAASFVILHGASDEPRDWIRAGEGLSAGWLTATERGVSVLPFSAPVEVIITRDALRRMLAYLYHPYLVLRLGTPGPAAGEASAS